MATENTFEINSEPIIEQAEELVLAIIGALKSIALRLSDNPSQQVLINQEIGRLQANLDAYESASREWVDENLSDAYLRGLRSAGSGQVVGGFSMLGLLAQGGGGAGISDKAKGILDKYPEHWTAYRVFQNDAYNAFNQSRLPIVRDVQDGIRDLVIKASEASYRDADTITRRKFSQEIMNRFADEGVTGVRYSNGRTMKIDSYAEMVARSQTKNAWNEATFNRMQEYGQDLVVISVHYPCSDLCIPYQGNVFSITGTSQRYPSLSGAISGGLYHPNCKHRSSPFNGDAPAKPITVTRNKKMYEAQQRQRQIERRIRYFKRKKAAALTPDAEKKAQQYISKWQKEARTHIDKNSFLRRASHREQI